jgi:hypothetical protein
LRIRDSSYLASSLPRRFFDCAGTPFGPIVLSGFGLVFSAARTSLLNRCSISCSLYWSLSLVPMTENPNSDSTPDDDELLLHLGKLIVTWNDLESVIRDIMYSLGERDILTAAILMADMNITTLMNILRAFSHRIR